MSHVILFEDTTHQNILLEDHGGDGLAVQANQHLIVHNGAGLLLDPGGHKVYSKVHADVNELLRGKGELEHIFLSHQDPDIVAASNGWLMTTDAAAHASELWLRFIPHFGLDRLVSDRMHGIADKGRWLTMGSSTYAFIPAHFLHSCGNFQLYDPHSKILYTGDLGASVGCDYREVTDFDQHLTYMRGFHARYMAGNKAMAAWATMARQLDIDIIAPQHGALFRGPELVTRFIDWCAALQCGMDLFDGYELPPK